MAAILSLLYDPTFSFRAGTELITTIFSKINEADILMNEDILGDFVHKMIKSNRGENQR